MKRSLKITRSLDGTLSPLLSKKDKINDDLPTPPNAGIENEVINRRLSTMYGTCKQTTTFLEFKQEMIFQLKVGMEQIRIQLIKSSQGMAQWKILSSNAWAIHHRHGLVQSIGKIITFNALLIGSHTSCNIIVPSSPAFTWKLACCLSGPKIEKVQIH